MSSTPKVNDVVITVATSNGTGSQSANLILMRTLFNMGIPVSGKNMFPSNIQGLPTWFTVRANAKGWTARRKDTDVLVAMNVESIADDIAGLKPGATLVITKSLASHVKREDLQVIVVPFDELVAACCKETRLRKMVVNIIYVGVLAYLLGMDLEEVKRATNRQFSTKASAAKLNGEAAQCGYDWGQKNLQPSAEFRFEKMHSTEGKIIIEGNQAAALGLVWGGVQVLAWYPITPSSSLCESTIDYLDELRKDENGKQTYAVVQAEDEIASIAMVIGAGWAGARAATATSGPGISLMSEFAGLSYFAEIPAVILDVQRMGPSTGLPTRTSQADIFKAYHLSHGDCKHPMLIPGNPAEAYEFAAESLNLAERLQTLVFVMLDLDLGMNSWVSDPFKPLDRPLDRGKVLTAADLDALKDDFQRYKDVDGDAIPYRTLPGTDHAKAAYFTRGTGHTEKATYSEKPQDWKNNIDRLVRKFNTARTLLPRPVVQTQPGAEIGIIAFGTSDPAVQEAREMLSEQGVKTDYMRLRALPIDKEVRQFIHSHRVVYVVEQNRDAQCTSILRLEEPGRATMIKPSLHYNGMPIDAASIVDDLLAQERSKEAA